MLRRWLCLHRHVCRRNRTEPAPWHRDDGRHKLRPRRVRDPDPCDPDPIASLKFSGHLDWYTLGGYMTPMRTEIKTSCLKRLKRIEGQIRGLAGMVENDRYCIDVVTQIAAAKAALRRVEEEILRDHVAHCVEHAITSGDKADQRRKIAEMMDVVSRADRSAA